MDLTDSCENDDMDANVHSCSENEMIDIDLSDPACWPNLISDALRVLLVKRGPPPINSSYNYPVNEKSQRKFRPMWQLKEMSNGEKVKRCWLMYSEKKDSIFCFYCKLFNASAKSFTTDGFNNWRKAAEILQSHERSHIHIRAQVNFFELSQRLRTDGTIDASHQRMINTEILHWREVMKRIMAIINFLGRQCLAFRGSSDRLYEKNNGNFLQLIELIADFDVVMAEHLRRIKNEECHLHYLSKTTQNEVISLISNEILQRILDELKTAKYYSIIIDCTQDISKKEQMSIILRYIKIFNESEIQICERFLGFIEIEGRTTGEMLTNELLAQLTKHRIPIEDMRGQSYDNGSNMRGKELGVQKRILDLNKRAFFVPCHCHSLNLVVNDAAKSSKDAISFFGIIQEVYNLFSGSARRWSILQKHVGKNLTVKGVSTTRWEARIKAVRPFRYAAGEIYDALYEISQDESFDAECRRDAENFGLKMQNFTFCCCVVIWHNILNQINTASKILQNISTDISAAKTILESTLMYLKKYRSEEGFEQSKKEAELIADDLDIDYSFPPVASIRKRKKKKMFTYEADDESITDPEHRFRTELFYTILDAAITSCEERFQQLNSYQNYFGFLYDIAKIKDTLPESKEALKKSCHELANALTASNDADINANEIFDELQVLTEIIPYNTTPKDALQFILMHKNVAPNTAIALRILITVPLSIASAERSFSKLRLIKNYLRSTMVEERLTSLGIISMENDLGREINYEEAINRFAQKKSRKIAF